MINIKVEFIPQLKEELSKFDTSEELLRGGGLSIELLDRLAHGFSESDIKTLHPSKLKVRWNDDIENWKPYYILDHGTKIEWEHQMYHKV